MRRTLLAGALALMLAACGTTIDRAPSASASPSASAAASTPPAPSAAASASLPALPEGHPAEGLALVQFPDRDSPASEIFVVEADGSLRQVTGHGGSLPGATNPRWSPDGSQIVFAGPKTGSPVAGLVAIVDADGGNERELTAGANPQWSPDGSRILLEGIDEATGNPTSILLLDMASGDVTELGPGFAPQWLPDGERITFDRMVENVPGTPEGSFTQISYVMALDGSEAEPLATGTHAFWAPDMSALLLQQETTLFLAGPDGSDPRELVEGYEPVWSPDATRIVFESGYNQDAIGLMTLIDLEGNVIWSDVVGDAPVWSADGTRLAVEISYPEAVVQVIDAATGEVLHEVEGGSDPAWPPATD